MLVVLNVFATACALYCFGYHELSIYFNTKLHQNTPLITAN